MSFTIVYCIAIGVSIGLLFVLYWWTNPRKPKREQPDAASGNDPRWHDGFDHPA